MTLATFLDRIVAILEDRSVPYMITGSLAAAYHGAPRATQDVDIVIEVDDSQVDGLSNAFEGSRQYVSRDAAHAAVLSEGQFNVDDPRSGWKADLIVRKSRPFSRAEFDRRAEVDVLGRSVFMVSAEDLVVAKLEWARLGSSERQLHDVRGILDVQGDALDRKYLLRWVADLGVEDVWRRVTGDRTTD